MRRATRLGSPLLLAVLVASGPVAAQLLQKPLPGPAKETPVPTPGPGADGGPALRIGALLPISGAASWYGLEMRRGMELAVAEVNPAPKANPAAPATGSATGPSAPSSEATPTPAEAASSGTAAPGIRIALEVVDVEPLNVKDAEAGFTRLAALGASVVFTASPTPTLAVLPLASSRDVLLVHQGPASDRLPAGRVLLQLRPPPAARGEALAAYAWERGLRRVAQLGAGDPFGKAVRAGLASGWRNRGGALALDENVALEASDLRAVLSRVVRLAPEAVCLAFQGADLGDLARQLRAAGYPGLLLAVDDDRAALLAAGPTLGDMIVLSDAFVPEPDSRGARFAKAFQGRFNLAPSRFAAHAYEATRLMAERARAAMEGTRGVPGGRRLRDALLAGGRFPSIFGGEARVRDDGALEHPFALFTVADGRATFVRYVTPGGQPPIEGRLPSWLPPTLAAQAAHGAGAG